MSKSEVSAILAPVQLRDSDGGEVLLGSIWEAPQGILQCHSHFILACDRHYVTCYLQHNGVFPTVCILRLVLLLMLSYILGFYSGFSQMLFHCNEES